MRISELNKARFSVLCSLVAVVIIASTMAANAAGQMQLTSTAFSDGSPVPVQYTCDGKDESPPLKWTGTPEGTKSFALIVDDPDAPMGTWTHWVLFDLAPDTTELKEDAGKSGSGDQGGHGTNSFKKSGYGGPCPPKGKPHHYVFKLYALDQKLGLKPGASRKDVEKAIQPHILAQGQLTGTYARK
jgi:Raf kinase inhibitor-like YbhB/YbcL family protein